MSPESERLDVMSQALARLLRRQEELERRLARLEGSHVHEAHTGPVPAVPFVAPHIVAPAVEPEPAPTFTTPEPEPSPPPSAAPAIPAARRPALETQFGLTLLNRIGVITLVLGIAFFFKWAVDSNWIGPAGRVVLGILAAFLALGAADVLWRKGQQVFAQGVTGAGVAIFYLSVYAAYGFYHLIAQGLAFVFLFCVTSLAVALALRYAAQAVAALGLVGAYLTPILLSSGEDHSWFLLSYILVLDAGAMLLAWSRRWRALEGLSFVATCALYIPWLFRFGEVDRWAGAYGAFAYWALYARASLRFLFPIAHCLAAVALATVCSNSASAFFTAELALAAGGLLYADLRRSIAQRTITFTAFWAIFFVFRPPGWLPHDAPQQWAGISCAFVLFFAWFALRAPAPAVRATRQYMALFVANGALYYAASYALLHPHYHAWLGLLAAIVAAAYLAWGVVAFRRAQRTQTAPDLRPSTLSLGVALCFIALAIPIQFTGFTITIAWALLAAALAWLGLRFASRQAQYAAVAVFALVTVRLAAIDSVMFPNTDGYTLLWNRRMVTFAVAAVSAFLAARWTLPNLRRLAAGEYLGGHVALLAGLALEVDAWAARSSPPENALSAQMVALSILLAVYAILLVSIGLSTRTQINRIAGLCLFALVIAKLYFVDVWTLGRIYRISAFVALGVLLLSGSFLYSHFRRVIESWWKHDEAGS